MLLTVGCLILGNLILVLTAFDIWATVLHPGVESPISNRFHRAGWRAIRLAARWLPGRATILHAGLPLLVGGLITLWLALLLVGFALLYFPWVGNSTAFDAPAWTGPAWFDALYLSGVTLFTLGFGDITPLTPPLRALAVIEAGSGMATISLAIAYVLAVYPALSRLQMRALALDAEVAGQVSGLPLLRRYLSADGHWTGDLDDRLRELALELLNLTESHETHPILYYQHPPRVEQSVLRMLVTVQHLIGLLRYGLSPERHAELVRDPQLLLLEQAFGYSLRRLSVSLHSPTLDRPDNEALRREYQGAYERLCDDLEELGLVSSRQGTRQPVPVLARAARHPDLADAGTGERPFAARPVAPGGDDEGSDPALDLASASPAAAYIAFREATDPHIAAYAVASGYSLEEATCGDAALWRLGEEETRAE